MRTRIDRIDPETAIDGSLLPSEQEWRDAADAVAPAAGGWRCDGCYREAVAELALCMLVPALSAGTSITTALCRDCITYGETYALARGGLLLAGPFYARGQVEVEATA